MSKIERALRKAEEEKRKRTLITPEPDEPIKDILATQEGISEPHKAQPGFVHISEHFRKIAAKLKAYYESAGNNDILFTSAISGEGKTTAAINCSISLCQDFNLSVCLIDCDLHHPKISVYFEPNGSPGIIDMLKGEADIDSVIQASPVKGLSLVHALRIGGPTLPLLNSERFRRLVQEFRIRFDLVIFDSPPVLPVADTAVISKHASGVVLVIESGKTRRKHIEQTLEQISHDKIIGFIMNYKKHRMPRDHNYTKYYNYGLAKE